MAKIGDREAQLRKMREAASGAQPRLGGKMAKQYTAQMFKTMSAAERRVQQGDQRRRIKEEEARNTKVFGPPIKPVAFGAALKKGKK
jgi:hypothetical protein